MIAHAGLLSYRTGQTNQLNNTVCTQRFRTDEVFVKWRRLIHILYYRLLNAQILIRKGFLSCTSILDVEVSIKPLFR